MFFLAVGKSKLRYSYQAGVDQVTNILKLLNISRKVFFSFLLFYMCDICLLKSGWATKYVIRKLQEHNFDQKLPIFLWICGVCVSV